jgi:hypothetical protein
MLLVRVNAVALFFGLFFGDDLNPAVLVLFFALLAQIKITMRNDYIGKPIEETLVS